MIALAAYNLKWEPIGTFRQAAVVLVTVFGLLAMLIGCVATVANVGLP